MDGHEAPLAASPAIPIDPALQETEMTPESSSEQNRTSSPNINKDHQTTDTLVTSDNDVASSSTPPALLKRSREVLGPKNLQACDRCRTKKTKCLPRDSSRSMCQACYGHGLTCTFDMPLTASRSKRVRKGLNGSQYGDGGYGHAGEHRHGRDGHDSAAGLGLLAAVLPESDASWKRLRRPGQAVTRLGSTSLEHIMHSAPSLPLSVLEERDQAAGVTIHRQGAGVGHVEIVRRHRTERLDVRAIASTTNAPEWRQTVILLVKGYIDRVASLVPIASPKDLLEETEGLLYHAAALVAATSQSCSVEVFNALRHIVNEAVRAEDVESVPTKRNIQILLMLSLMDDTATPHSLAAPSSITRRRLLCAIQMLRDVSDFQQDAEVYRLWQVAIVLDLWHSTKIGFSPLSENEEIVGQLGDHEAGGDFFDHLIHLSSLLCRVNKQVYGRGGITLKPDAPFEEIRDDLKRWHDGLPDSLRLTSLSAPVQAGLLHLLHNTVLFLLYRPFMRWSFDVPSGPTFNLDLRVWSELHSASQSGLEWVSNMSRGLITDANAGPTPDLSGLLCWGGYAVGMACFLQYHHWARRRDGGAVIMLEKVRDSVRAWAADGKLGELRQELEVVEVLYDATTKLTGVSPDELRTYPRGLDPTLGSYNRQH